MEDTLEQGTQSGSEEIAEMAAFFAKLGSLVAVEEQKERETSAGLREFFSSFKEIWQKEKSRELPNIFELCRLDKNEVGHCRILAWLLDENGSHGYGNRFLKEILSRSIPNETAVSKGIPEEALLSDYQVRTEVCPNSDPANRIDIVCDGKDFLLYIEVKIDAPEGSEQLPRYSAKLNHNAHGREKVLLYLWRGIDPGPDHDAVPFRKVRWRDVAAMLREVAEDDDISSNGAEAVRQYAGCIEKFCSFYAGK